MNIDNINSREQAVNENGASTEAAAPKQKARRQYVKHGDIYRQKRYREWGLHAIDGRTRAGKDAKAWYRFALSKKGGKRSCPIDTRKKIEAGAVYLWRADELLDFIVTDARTRGTPINKRHRTLPGMNEQYDTAFEQWKKINDELELDKGLDLARRYQLEKLQQGGK